MQREPDQSGIYLLNWRFLVINKTTQTLITVFICVCFHFINQTSRQISYKYIYCFSHHRVNANAWQCKKHSLCWCNLTDDLPSVVLVRYVSTGYIYKKYSFIRDCISLLKHTVATTPKKFDTVWNKNRMQLFSNLINSHFTISWKIWAHFQFNGCSMCQKSRDSSNKRLILIRLTVFRPVEPILENTTSTNCGTVSE